MLLQLALSFLIFAAFGIRSAQAQGKPFELKFADETFGADGPWYALDIQIGSQNLHLFPGAFANSNIIYKDPDICETGEEGICDHLDGETLSLEESISPSGWPTRTLNMADYLENGIGFNNTVVLYDYVEVKGSGTKFGVDNCTFTLAKNAYTELPSGRKTAPMLGTFSLGSNETRTLGEGTKFTLDVMRGEKRVSSRSWGMHLGSTHFGQRPSLVFGGYDQSRLISNPLDFKLEKYPKHPLEVDILKIHLGAIDNVVPIESLELGPLKSTSPAMSVQIDPSVPYLHLPEALCTLMTENLPVKFDEDFELYFWDTENPNYKKVIDSDLFFSFLFPKSLNQPEQEEYIKIPIKLLHLTLKYPLITDKDEERPFFPCQPTFGRAVLGRAFLQAVFLGVNWEEGIFFVGQAPGPGTKEKQNIVSINPTAKSLRHTTGVTWESTWKGNFLPSKTGGSPRNPTKPNPTSEKDQPEETTNPDSKSEGSSLSIGLIVGIAAGVVVVIIIIIIAISMFWRRKLVLQLFNAVSVGTDGKVIEKKGSDSDSEAGSTGSANNYKPKWGRHEMESQVADNYLRPNPEPPRPAHLPPSAAPNVLVYDFRPPLPQPPLSNTSQRFMARELEANSEPSRERDEDYVSSAPSLMSELEAARARARSRNASIPRRTSAAHELSSVSSPSDSSVRSRSLLSTRSRVELDATVNTPVPTKRLEHYF